MSYILNIFSDRLYFKHLKIASFTLGFILIMVFEIVYLLDELKPYFVVVTLIKLLPIFFLMSLVSYFVDAIFFQTIYEDTKFNSYYDTKE